MQRIVKKNIEVEIRNKKDPYLVKKSRAPSTAIKMRDELITKNLNLAQLRNKLQ